MNRQISNILIRDLTAEDNDAIRAVMQETGCNRASKAAMKAIYSFPRMSTLVKKQTNRIKELETENHVLRQNSAVIVEASRKLDSVLSKTR